MSRRLLILYGSETGTAADLAHELSRLVERHHFLPTCLAASALSPPDSLPSWPLVVFVCATTGQGEMPANAKAFWRFLLRKKIPTDWLKGTCFTTFGCGDSTYAGFNWAVRKLHRRLLQVGAVEVAERGEGDEQHADGIDGAFLPWSSRLLEVLLERYPLPEGVAPIPKEVLLPPKWVLELAEGAPGVVPVAAGVEEETHVPRPGALVGVLSANDRVTPETHFQDVRHIKITLPTPVSYAPGDTISLLPKNHPDDVAHLLELQSWQSIADRPLQLLPNPAVPTAALPPSPIPNPVSPLTLRTLLTHHVDITAIPRRSFFATIAALTTDDTHAERLREFTDPQYTDELYDYTTRPRRSILEVLQEFSTVAIPLDRILEVFPPLHERRFSIASPPTTEPEVEILVAVVKYRTIIKKIREGVCTRWLAALKPGAEVTVAFQRGGLGDAAGRPAVMVAPGTGVAPMRALVGARAAKGEGAGALLFFGCRNEGADFFFRGEWEALEERGAVRVFTAFSRDQKSKRYVQHVIREKGEEVYDAVVRRGGVVYVCGSSGRMPSAVREALVEVFEKWGSMGREEAEEFLKMLETDGRWRQETWG
ncbi:riboflavin synthase domain-like protein [Morchella conica CCBAS932]|uniref:NADPH-dependent diflavin oxidoreductase 1 n=1 Tax=Morchella conica CCBAS932 TaxID=1392247 RepID=A0A3N4KTE4_9PEZI|nr:riboflavin synthase domain-like protein [Morchella conica CCBAS932]